MEESFGKILELAISQGIWAVLYIYLFFRMIKENKVREENYQKTIDIMGNRIESGISRIEQKLDDIESGDTK